MTDISTTTAPSAAAAKAPTKLLGTVALGIAATLAVISIVSHNVPAVLVTIMMALTIAGVGLRIYAAIRGAGRQAPPG